MGKRAEFLAETITKHVDEIASDGSVDWLVAYDRFMTTDQGRILQTAYGKTVR